MTSSKTKRFGILGGMGPDATVHFYKILLEQSEAKTDQEHLETIIAVLPHIPDRTAAILHGGEDPSMYLLEGIELLAQAGAKFAIITCNTAHYFLPRIADRLPIPVLNMIECVAKDISSQGCKTAGLLATTGTVQTGLYDRYLKKYGVEIVHPKEADQVKVMNLIYGKAGIKAGFISEENRLALLELSSNFFDQGVDVLILGCTELPLVLKSEDKSDRVIDPFVVLAREAIRFAKGE